LERKGNFLSLDSFIPTIHSHKTVRKLLNLYITTSGQCSYIGDVATNDHSTQFYVAVYNSNHTFDSVVTVLACLVEWSVCRKAKRNKRNKYGVVMQLHLVT